MILINPLKVLFYFMYHYILFYFYSSFLLYIKNKIKHNSRISSESNKIWNVKFKIYLSKVADLEYCLKF